MNRKQVKKDLKKAETLLSGIKVLNKKTEKNIKILSKSKSKIKNCMPKFSNITKNNVFNELIEIEKNHDKHQKRIIKSLKIEIKRKEIFLEG